MRRALFVALAAILLLPLLLWACLRTGLLTPFANLALSHQLKSLTSAQVRLGGLRSDLFTFIEADDVVVLAPIKDAKLPLLTLSTLRLEFKLWPALRGRLPWSEALRLARIKGLNIFVLHSPQGIWNLEGLGLPGPKKASSGPEQNLARVIPAGRVELEDCQVVVNDEPRGFRATIDGIQGSLDTRALPLVAFSLSARTEGHRKENLSITGEWDQRDLGLDARLDLAQVELSTYLNYLLPEGTVRFEGGRASLSARLSRGGEDRPWNASGRAHLEDGRLRIPGVAEPVDGIRGAIDFDPKALSFKGLRAKFLAAEWSASGALLDLKAPHFDVILSDALVPLSELTKQVQGMDALGLSGTARVSATLKGPVASPVVEARLEAPWLGMFGLEMDSVKAEARLHGARLDVPKLQANLWGGRLDAEGDMGLQKGGHLRADALLDGAELDQARMHGTLPLPMSGTAWAHLKARGLLRSPDLGLDLEVTKASMGVLSLGSLSAEAAWSNTQWSASFQALSGAVKGQLMAKGPHGGNFQQSRIDLKPLDLKRVLDGLATAPPSLAVPDSAGNFAIAYRDRIQAKGSLSMALDGPVGRPRLSFDLDLDRGKFFPPSGFWALDEPEEGFDFKIKGAVSLALGQTEIYFGDGKAPLLMTAGPDGEWTLSAQGHMPLGRGGAGGDLALEAAADLEALESLQLFKKAKGKLSARARLGGSFDNIAGDGELSVENFNAKTQGYLAPIKDGTLSIQLKGQRLHLQGLQFSSGGAVKASGELELAGGWAGLKGWMQAESDAEGLRLEEWPGLGSGNVILAPLRVELDGETEPLIIKGRANLSNALITYGAQGEEEAPADTAPAASSRPLSLDLRVGLGANVWYEKRQQRSVDFFDPKKALSGALDSLAETFLQPDLFFRLRPSEQDFVIQGISPDVQVGGELVIDRGRLTIMENDFSIRSDQTVSKIVFRGQRAEIWADASARLRYTRNDPYTGRPRTKVVNVVAQVRPMPEEELARSQLAGTRLNYNLARFIAEPRLTQSEALEKSAVLNLVVFGDPMVDLEGDGGVQSFSDQSNDNVALETQLNRVLSAEARKQVAKWSRYGLKFLGTNFIDVFRVVPRFRYSSAGPTSGSNGVQATANQASKQSQESTLVWSDLTLEVGKSLGEKLYSSAQFVMYGENGLNQVANTVALSQGQVVRDRGVRTGLEYQVSPNRTIELYYNYSVDDNLEPVAFNPSDLSQAHSVALRMRNTIPMANYSSALAHQRRWEKSGAKP